MRTTIRVCGAAMAIMPASLALAAEEKTGAIPSIQQGLVTGITGIVVFLIVLVVLAKTVWPKIAAGLDEREEKIRQEIAAAEAARKQAKDALAEYEANLADARAQANTMLEETKAQQVRLAADLKASAQRDADQLRDKAMRDIEVARKAALSDIYTQAGTLATSIASKILQRELNPDDQQRLVDESLSELQSAMS